MRCGVNIHNLTFVDLLHIHKCVIDIRVLLSCEYTWCMVVMSVCLFVNIMFVCLYDFRVCVFVRTYLYVCV